MTNISIMQDASEIVPFDDPNLPLYIALGTLSAFPNHRMLCHWHDAFEIISILEGSMYYQIGEQKMLLSAGDTLLINARQLHYGFSSQNSECRYYCILCQAELLGQNNRVLYRQFLAPMLENQNISHLYFGAQEEISGSLFKLITEIYHEKESAVPAYELLCLSKLYALWHIVYPHTISPARDTRDYSDETLQKDMVSYIQTHFSEHITLSDIAAAGHICQNKCCVIFRRYLQQSPIDFLNAYRLNISCGLLKHTSKSISDIALSCGFNHSSYYTKLFQRKYGCTPSTWRKQHRNTQ